jgi:hypothetical protein
MTMWVKPARDLAVSFRPVTKTLRISGAPGSSSSSSRSPEPSPVRVSAPPATDAVYAALVGAAAEQQITAAHASATSVRMGWVARVMDAS